MALKWLAIAVIVSGCSAAGPLAAAEVHTTAGLLSALESAKPGDTIRLAPGLYSDVIITGVRFAKLVTITSADSARPASLAGLKVNASAGLAFIRLDFTTTQTPPGPFGASNTIPFNVSGSSDIHFDRVMVHGSANGTLATDELGMIIRDSDRVSITHSEFTHLHDAFAHIDDTHIDIKNNYFHNNRDDSIRGGGTSWLVISGNRCESNHFDKEDLDHPDCIQIWTIFTKTPAHDIVITGNIYIRGTGAPTQGVFVKDEVGNLPETDVTITGNVIVGAIWNGIEVIGGKRVEISDNIVAPFPDQMSRIGVSGGNTITAKDNKAGDFFFKGPNLVHLTTANNVVIEPVKDGGMALLQAWCADHPETPGSANR